jgi:hypothetical protein
MEQLIVNAVNTMTQWKVPFDGLGIRCLVKSYLDKQGVQDRRFNKNLPGIDWLKRFMARHGRALLIVLFLPSILFKYFLMQKFSSKLPPSEANIDCT